MPYVPAHLLLEAVNAIEGAHALTVVTLPALLREAKRQNVDPTTAQVPYGGGVEEQYLKDFYELPGAPDPHRPYRAIWSGDTPWQTRKFTGGGLQRQRGQRAGRGEVLIQRKPAQTGLPGDVWGLTPSAGADLLAETKKPVRLIDLALWIGRDVDTSTIDPAILAAANLGPAPDDIDKLNAWFKHEFRPACGDLVGTIFTDDVPTEYRSFAFAADPVSDETYQQLGVLPPAPTVTDDLSAVVGSLEGRIQAKGFQLPPGLVGRVVTAWLRGDLVVLVGQPGTGKTLFATLLGSAMEQLFDLDAPLMIPVRADFDEAELIGYERLDGTVHLQDFAREILLDDAPLEARVVIFEEFNLASVETYLSAVLVATQERERIVRLPDGEVASLPIDTFVLATCNSFRDEPETRTRVSSPTKRRSTTITMPNVLGDRYEDDPDTAVAGAVQTLIANERERVEGRKSAGHASQFDSLRLTALHSVSDFEDFSPEAQQALVAVSNAVLETTSGRSWFTLGILRDVVMALVMSERDAHAELTALGNAVADKIVHQLRGAHSDAQPLLDASATLPNAEEIGRLIEQTMSGPSDELLPLL
ncbi:AAA family ATPase [Streptomyces sp. 4503]|uniref:AAA family ATPase n=1 Tax=Streptomyces niphimycinicus TaxID=2842201 RepID=A0ABS6CGZ4_9ACTN|nr:AAA family ATPase [Streptomyces niphimycinicus]MBU3866196.1 AAA family ATPase [Streptomyces niphimycinicus]